MEAVLGTHVGLVRSATKTAATLAAAYWRLLTARRPGRQRRRRTTVTGMGTALVAVRWSGNLANVGDSRIYICATSSSQCLARVTSTTAFCSAPMASVALLSTAWRGVGDERDAPVDDRMRP